MRRPAGGQQGAISSKHDTPQQQQPQSIIPVIDISAWTQSSSSLSDMDDSLLQKQEQERNAVAEQIAQACREIGFFAITGHGVDPVLVEATVQVSRDFFDLPEVEKRLFQTDDETIYPYGYEQSECLSRGKRLQQQQSTQHSKSNNNNTNSPTHPDLKETFSIGPSNSAAGMPPRRFPTHPVHFAATIELYYTAMEQLGRILLRILAQALALPLQYFDDRMDRHLSALRLLNYFAVDDVQQALIGSMRASAHTDYGPMTILYSGGPGLQVCQDQPQQHHLNNRAADTDGHYDDDPRDWVDAPCLNEAFIINLGDLMQRWTNDKWVSTLHRVVLKPQTVLVGDGSSKGGTTFVPRRQSLAFFVNVNGDTVVEPLPTCVNASGGGAHYPPIVARDHLMAKHLASMGLASDPDRESKGA